MIIYVDGSGFDDIISLIVFLKGDIKIDAIIITSNSWSHTGPSYSIITNLIAWFGKSDIPVIMGSLYALIDYEYNYEREGFIQGQTLGKVVPDNYLVDVDFLYGLGKYIPQYDVGHTYVYNPDYKKLIMKVIDSLDKIDIVSTGKMTDVYYTLEMMQKENKLDKLNSLWQFGSYLPDGEIRDMQTICRSYNAEYNMYLDPHAAQKCIDIAGDKITFVLASVIDKVQVDIPTIKEIAIESGVPESVLTYLIVERRQEGANKPEEEEEDKIVIWDAIGATLYLNRELIQNEKKYPICLNTDLEINRDTKTYCHTCNNLCDYNIYNTYDGITTYTYSFDHHLGEIYVDNECGACINFLTNIDIDKTRNKFYEILGQEKNSAKCPLLRPIGCYEYEEIIIN